MPWAAPVTTTTLSWKRMLLLLGRLGHGLGLEVLLEPGNAHLAAEARLLVPAERGVRAEPDAPVHRHGPGADPLGHGLRPLEVPGVDRPGEPVVGVVGDADGVVVTVVRDDDEHGPEDLLLGET